MNLYRLLQAACRRAGPVRVGLIGAGKFGSMFLSQVPTTPGLQVAAIADLSPDRARAACRGVGWTEERIAATRFTDDAMAMIAAGSRSGGGGDRPRSRRHRPCPRHAIREGKHIVMVNVEADVLAGPLLAREAEAAGVVYSLAYGDQPALDLRAGGLGAEPAASPSSPPARAPSTCRNTTPPRPTRCGAITA